MAAPLCATCHERPAVAVWYVKSKGRLLCKRGRAKNHDECWQCHRATCERMSPKFRRASAGSAASVASPA